MFHWTNLALIPIGVFVLYLAYLFACYKEWIN